MAGIFEQLHGDARTRNTLRNLRLEFIRFRKFLENMREILRLVDDVEDKLREEYIFDRHYVLSLVDAVLEEASMLTFNSSVLSPPAGKEFYLQLDEHKKYAQKEFLEAVGLSEQSMSVLESYREADPETQLLAAVLNWLTGPLPGDQPSVMDFIRYVTDEAFENCRKEELMDGMGASVRHVPVGDSRSIRVIDVGEASLPKKRKSVPHGEIQCRPFGMLLTGLQDGAASGGLKEIAGIEPWMLFDEEAVSLRNYRDNAKIHLEAELHGNVASDFIFLYSRDPGYLKAAAPHGFRIEKTGRGTLAWIYDVPTDTLEQQLVRLGSMLLC